MPYRTPSIVAVWLAVACELSCSSASLVGSGPDGTGSGGQIGSSDGAGATGSADGSLACTAKTPAPPAPTGDAVRDTAQANEFMFVDAFVGAYLRGDNPIYAGVASATDTSGNAPLAFSSSSAIAALVIDSNWAILTVASPADHERLILNQQSTAPDVTRGGGILPDGAYLGGYGSANCTSCTPDFFSRPPSLAWSGVDATFPGSYPDGGGVFPAFDITSSVDLQPQSPCALTWDQVAAVHGGPLDFVQVGNEMVEHENGWVQTVAPSFRSCDGQAVPYTIDRYINLTNLFDYGVRNYVAGSPMSLCGGA